VCRSRTWERSGSRDPCGLLLAVTVRFIGGYSEFIYFQF